MHRKISGIQTVVSHQSHNPTRQTLACTALSHNSHLTWLPEAFWTALHVVSALLYGHHQSFHWSFITVNNYSSEDVVWNTVIAACFTSLVARLIKFSTKQETVSSVRLSFSFIIPLKRLLLNRHSTLLTWGKDLEKCTISPVHLQSILVALRSAVNPQSTTFRTCISGFHLFRVYPGWSKLRQMIGKQYRSP